MGSTLIRTLLSGAVIAGLASSAGLAVAQDARTIGKDALLHQPDAAFLPGSVIVKFRDDAVSDSRSNARLVVAAKASHAFAIVPGLERLEVGMDVDQAVTLLKAMPGVEYAVANGAMISNNSWGGGGFSTALRDAIASAGAGGHLFVAAAGNNGDGTVTFSWSDNASDEDGFEIQREQAQRGRNKWGSATTGTVGADVTSVIDNPGAFDTFRYRVRSFNGGGSSSWSAWVVTVADPSGGGGDDGSNRSQSSVVRV